MSSSTLPKISYQRKNKKNKDENLINDSFSNKETVNKEAVNKESIPSEYTNVTPSFTILTQEESKDIKPKSSEKKNKIGTYASTEFQNWMNTPIQKPKMKRSKKTNEEAFQIFQDFSERCETEEWRNFFEKLYTGKFPHGYSYRNQTLFFRKRTKIEKLDILDNSKDTMNKVMTFFKIYGGFNNYNSDLNIFDYLISQSSHYYQNWKDIRSKKTKQFFIQKYVDDISKSNNLSYSEKKSLLDTIHTAFLLKLIDSNDIQFENNKITAIKTLKWNNEKKTFDFFYDYKPQKPSRKATNEKISKNSFLAHWNKFLSNIIQKDKSDKNNDDIVTDVSTTEDLTDITAVSVTSFTD